MMDTLEIKKGYPCEPVTTDELQWVLDRTAFGDQNDAEKLQKALFQIRTDPVPWASIRTLCILGHTYRSCNSALRKAKLKPGIYINHDGDCLFLIHPDESGLQPYLDLHCKSLKSLVLYHTLLSNLDISSLKDLERLQISYHEELRKINIGTQLNHLTDLQIASCYQLTQLAGLENLTQLSVLELSYCRRLTDLPGLEKLTQLKVLRLSSCSSLARLPGLAHLTQLVTLELSFCRSLTQLPGLEKLTKLALLYLSGCNDLTEVTGLEDLTQLTALSLSDCFRLSPFPRLGNLTNLQALDLSGCPIREIPAGIRGMRALRRLYLRDLKLRELPDWLPEIADGFSLSGIPKEGTRKATVFLYSTTVEAIPDLSILEQPYKIVAKWFADRSKVPLNEIKVVFLGDGEAGKSHTIARLMNDGGEPDFAVFDGQSTPGIVIRHKDYTADGRNFRVHYWDFGGQEIMHSMHRIFLTGRTMYVILLNARDDIQNDRAKYWLHNVKSFAPDAPVLLVLNKIDQNESASVDEPDLRSRYGNLTQVVRMSARDFSRVEFNHHFTDKLLAEILKTGYLDARWPIAWTQVKQTLENMESHYIMGDAYEAICEKCSVDQNQQALLHWFNDLGVSFCCCDEEDFKLKDYVILRPDWITNALYIILFNRLEGACNGRIPHASIFDILSNAHKNPKIRCTLPKARYNANDIQYVLGIMRKFSLSFADGSEHEFIPMLCQQNSTVNISYYQKDTDILEFNMDFDYLPNNLLHRLMVERHNELDMDKVWRTGAGFELKELGYSAVVVIDGNTLRFFIRHTDPMHRPNTYLTMLKAHVDRIVRKMGLKEPRSRLTYKLDGRQDVFDFAMLKAMQEAGQSEAFSMTWLRMIPIERIMNQAAPDGLEDEKKLLDAIRRSCQRIQGDPIYCLDGDGKGLEDRRNRRIRDDLFGWGYNIMDQSQRGHSVSGKSIGELDLLLFNDKLEPWTIIESLRISSGSTTEWKQHLTKLVENYNYFGAPFCYLLTYVDADPASFARIGDGFSSLIQGYAPAGFVLRSGSFVELDDDRSPRYIRTAKCQYDCGGKPITVYHIFARIPLRNE